MNIEMYKIKEFDEAVMVPCSLCAERGVIAADCGKCGGKGVHKKTIHPYRICRRTVTIIKIDRDSKTSNLRYWTSSSEYFPEERKLVHFTEEDAQEECTRRNKVMGLETILSTLENNKVKKGK